MSCFWKCLEKGVCWTELSINVEEDDQKEVVDKITVDIKESEQKNTSHLVSPIHNPTGTKSVPLQDELKRISCLVDIQDIASTHIHTLSLEPKYSEIHR